MAGFLGQPKMNFLAGSVAASSPAEIEFAMKEGQAVRLGKFQAVQRLAAGTPVTLGVRPDAFRLAQKSEPSSLAGRVSVVERLGTTTLVHVTPLAVSDLVTVEVAGKATVKPGEEIWLAPDTERCHLFDQAGKRLVGDLAPA